MSTKAEELRERLAGSTATAVRPGETAAEVVDLDERRAQAETREDEATKVDEDAEDTEVVTEETGPDPGTDVDVVEPEVAEETKGSWADQQQQAAKEARAKAQEPPTEGDLCFMVDQDHMLRALAEVKQGVGTRSPLPILAGVVLETHGERSRDRTTITMTDLEVTNVLAINATEHGKGRAIVMVANLIQALKVLGDGVVEFSIDDGELKLVLDDQAYRLTLMGVNDYPKAKEFEAKFEDSFMAEFLIDPLRRVITAASTSDVRPILTGVSFQVEDGQLRLVATDGYRLAYETTNRSWDGGEALIPQRYLVKLIRAHTIRTMAVKKVLGVDDYQPYLTVQIGEREARFVYGNMTSTVRLIEGAFPNYKLLIPEKFATVMVMDREALVTRLKPFGGKNDHIPMRFGVEDGVVWMNHTQQDVGGYRAPIPQSRIEGDDSGTCGFNVVYFLDGVKQLTNEVVRLEVVDPLKPALMREGGFTYLCMPVRL